MKKRSKLMLSILRFQQNKTVTFAPVLRERIWVLRNWESVVIVTALLRG